MEVLCYTIYIRRDMKKIFYKVRQGRFHKTYDKQEISFLQSLGFVFFDVSPETVTDEDVVEENKYLEDNYDPTPYTRATLQQAINYSVRNKCYIKNNIRHIADVTTAEDVLILIKHLKAGKENQYLDIDETEAGNVIITHYDIGD